MWLNRLTMDFDPEKYTIISTPCVDIYTGDIVLYMGNVYYFKGNGLSSYLYKSAEDLLNMKDKIVVVKTRCQRVRLSHLTDETEPPRIKPKYSSYNYSDDSSCDEEDWNNMTNACIGAFVNRKIITETDPMFNDSLLLASTQCTPESYQVLLSLAQRYTKVLNESLSLGTKVNTGR